MQVILATLKKELISFFFSPIAYIIAVVLYLLRAFEINGYVAMAIDQQWDVDTFLSVYVMAGGGVSTILFFVLVPPILTMRFFAEEKRTGSLEVLMTAPVRDFEVVLGKWLAAVVFFILLWLPTVLLLELMSMDGFLGQSFAPGPLFAAYLGLFLLGGMLLAVGMFTSSITDNVLLAAMVALVLNLGFMQAPRLIHPNLGDSYTASVLRDLTHVAEHLGGWFGRGQIDSSKVVFYLGGMAFFLFLTTRSLESRKWR